MKNILIFLAGGIVGSVITAKFVEKYYKEAADAEIESVVDHFKNAKKEIEKKGTLEVDGNKTEVKAIKNKEEEKELKEIINSENYDPSKINSDIGEKTIECQIESITGIEIIDPMDFGEDDNFETKSWMFWADNVLTNEYDEIVEDPQEFIGDALSRFGNEDDSIYVRNRANNTDYEILKSEKSFNE